MCQKICHAYKANFLFIYNCIYFIFYNLGNKKSDQNTNYTVENVKNIKIAKNLLNITFSPFSSLTDRLTDGQNSSNVKNLHPFLPTIFAASL